jgi:2'-5' RNA ligase
MNAEPRARGLSLWLMPHGSVRDDLNALIARLAERLGTETFEPHVTLLPGVTGPDAKTVDQARGLAAELRPLVLDPAELDGLDAHFRCLFVRMASSPNLRDAHARAARRFGREPDPSFDPHLSLVYGTVDDAAKAALKEELAVGATKPFEARRLHVWRTEGEVGGWREVAAFDLGSASGD